MGKPLNIVMFWFMRDWGMYGRAYEQIAIHLAERPEVGRVVCVVPPTSIEPGKYAWPLSFFHKSRKLWAISLVSRVAPSAGAPYRLKKWANSKLSYLAFRAFIRLLGFSKSNTLLWLYPPHDYIQTLKEMVPHCARVVQIVDNNVHMESKPADIRRETQQQYDALVASADCVIVSSQANLDYFAAKNDNTFLFENALDSSFLRTASELPCRLNGTRPRLGYVGWISERTDIELLTRLAQTRPGYDLILAGPASAADISALVELPNVNWLGPVPYSKVADLMLSFDVCLIPHRDTPYSRSMSPLKLFQYLGSGRPIVTTDVAGVERWRNLLLVAGNHDDFIDKVDIALHTESVAKAEARIAAASRETWGTRVEQMLHKVLGDVR